MFWSVEDENRIVELKENNPRTTWEDISQDIDERHNAMACRKRFLGTLPMELKVKMTLAQRRLVCKMLSREHPASYEEISKALLPDHYKPDDIKHFYDLIATDKEVVRGYRDARGEASKVGSRLKDLPPSGLTTTGTTSSSAPTPADGAGTTAPSSLTSKRPARTIPMRTVTSDSGEEKRGGRSKYARRNPRYWTEEEENTLLEMYSENKPWQEISDAIGGRSVVACQAKFRRMDVDAVIDAKRKREETITFSKEEPTPKKLKINEDGDHSQEKHAQSQIATTTGPVTRHQARLSRSEKQQ